VRWESAAPVIEARKRQPDSGTEENYIVSVSGLPLFGGRPPGMGAEAPAGGGRAGPPRPERRATQSHDRIIEAVQCATAQGEGPDCGQPGGGIGGQRNPYAAFP